MKGKKVLIFILTITLTLFSLNLSTKARDFSGQEEKYNKICNGYIAPNDPNRAVCEEYKQYLLNKRTEYKDKVDALKSEIASVGAELADISAKSQKISAQMESMYARIVSIEATVETMKQGITKVENNIKTKNEEIKRRKQLILDRIPELAVKANTNQYIDFIMGAENLVDLIQRSSSIDSFTKYDKEMIETFQKDLKLLEAEKEEQQRLVEQQQVQLAILEEEKEILEVAYAEVEALATLAHEKQENLMEMKTEAERAQRVANAAANQIQFTEQITSSSGLISPIRNGYTSAGTWSYPSGGLHLGLDKATSIGTSVYAPANGIVLEAITSTSSSGGGYLGNMIGYPYGGGNTLHILVQAGGSTYAMSFFHLSPNVVSKGASINQGQLIAYTGNTGNSSGPHCHIEVFKLNLEFNEAVNYWNSHFDWAWGCGWSSGGTSSSVARRIRPETLGW